MIVIGTALAALAVIVTVLLVAADPVLLSRVNGRPAEGAGGGHVPTVGPATLATAAVHVPAPRTPAPEEIRHGLAV